MTKKRLLPADRKQEILNAALLVASGTGGYAKLTRLAVAKKADCAEALVSKYFGTMISFKRAIMRAAIANSELSIIAQGLAAGDKCAIKAPTDLKARAIYTLVG